MRDPREQFIRDELFNCTVRGAFQRARIYEPTTDERAKENFREALRQWLTHIELQYCEAVSEETHIENILSLSKELSEQHAGALVKGRFRIGVAQKALNLYLKYLWCLGKVPAPPHCPFDSIVIENLPGCDNISWTKFDTREEYCTLVEAAKKIAGAKRLAQWELEAYSG